MSFDRLLRELVAGEVARAIAPLVDEVRALRTAMERQEPSEPERYLSTADAAQLMAVRPTTVRRWVTEGRLRGYGTPRSLRVARAELLALDPLSEMAPDVQTRAAEIVAIHGSR